MVQSKLRWREHRTPLLAAGCASASLIKMEFFP